MSKNEFTTATSPHFTQTNRRIIEQQQQQLSMNDDDDDVNEKSRKFRWSACFSFISKLKKSKSPPSQNNIRSSQSFEDFSKKLVNYNLPSVGLDDSLSDTIEDSDTKQDRKDSTSSSLWKQSQQPPVSLSPPPRHGKNKRDSHITNTVDMNDSTTTHRRPLIDPTLTPRVKPTRSNSSKKQPSLLRLSLDAELLQQQASPDGVLYTFSDNESISTTGAHSSSLLSFSPTTTQYRPFRSETLGVKNQNKLSFSSSESELPPLPPQQQQQLNIPLNSTNTSNSSIVTAAAVAAKRPISTQSAVTILTSSSSSNISQQQQHQYLIDSPAGSNISATTDDDEAQQQQGREKLTLKERRHRRSPLTMPDTDQLTLALKGLEQQQLIEQHEKKRSVPTTPIPSVPLPPINQQPPTTRRRSASSTTTAELQYNNKDGGHYYESSDEDDLIWRQQLLEQSIAFSFQNKSRQDAMLTLEGKKTSHHQQRAAVSLQPIVNVHDLDHHFSTTNSSDDERDNTVRDVFQDKAQYDAIVSRTRKASQQPSHQQEDQFITTNKKSFYRNSLRARSASDSSSFGNKFISSQQQQSDHQLDIISENEVVHSTKTVAGNNKVFTIMATITPETPPHHQLNAPSLISAPSTPNSIDSSVMDHDDYLSSMTFAFPTSQ